jgi:hypothetical protein
VVIAVLAALAEVYLDNLSEETSKGKRARAAAGLPNGDLPFGYRSPEQGGSGQSNRAVPVIVPEQAEAVRLAFELYGTGQYSDARVASALNDASHRMRSKRHPDGYPFTKNTHTAMLDNPYYAGWVTYTGNGSGKRGDAQRVRGQHAPIMAQELFDRVIAIRVAKRGQGRAGSPAGTRHHREGTMGVYVAAGLARCRCCRERLRIQPCRTTTITYRDTGKERGIKCTATKRSIPLEIVDEAVHAYVSALQLPEDWQAHAVGASTPARRRSRASPPYAQPCNASWSGRSACCWAGTSSTGNSVRRRHGSIASWPSW